MPYFHQAGRYSEAAPFQSHLTIFEKLIVLPSNAVHHDVFVLVFTHERIPLPPSTALCETPSAHLSFSFFHRVRSNGFFHSRRLSLSASPSLFLGYCPTMRRSTETEDQDDLTALTQVFSRFLLLKDLSGKARFLCRP